ncbi:hypothetical protein JCM21714_2132 [Gracilibacillus boraciitolerans JCM 21714]|uniref:Uncharacterized protein n=1 Tax=Gracilibacillus boraciitolerans JCM 21714 TaxID=1298598 RepID=W4VI61_9BACI|nr:hypothetical protein [Gracilibacillus boraciitolerans]GAE93095.1 hypothetical protein JCM21714_2132 [Gracilibacillus boraciitolerans JCM 21714]
MQNRTVERKKLGIAPAEKVQERMDINGIEKLLISFSSQNSKNVMEYTKGKFILLSTIKNNARLLKVDTLTYEEASTFIKNIALGHYQFAQLVEVEKGGWA